MLVMSICTFICVATIFTVKFCIRVFLFEMPIQRLLAVVQNFLANGTFKITNSFLGFFQSHTSEDDLSLAAGELGSGLPGGGLPGGE